MPLTLPMTLREADELQSRVWHAEAAIGACMSRVWEALCKAQKFHGPDSDEAKLELQRYKMLFEEERRVKYCDEDAIKRADSVHGEFFRKKDGVFLPRRRIRWERLNLNGGPR